MTDPTTRQSPMPPIIDARGIRVAIAGTEILRGVDLRIERGEAVAIMGASGSGKSTLLYALSGMDAITAGTIAVDGADLGALNQAQLGQLRLGTMGFVFQQPQLLANLSLLDNVVLPGFTARRHPRRAVIARARDLMRRAGVEDLADRYLTQASGGQLQRVGICRALINEPAVVFADEPTGALDSAATEGVLRLLHAIHAESTTLVTVTHDAAVAARAQRVLAMRDGAIAAELTLGTVADIDDADALAARRERVTAWLAAEASPEPARSGDPCLPPCG